jgi:putative DNA primase/helicase
LTASAETIVKAARIENLYRDHEFLANLARLEVQDPPEAEAIKATVARIDGFRQRAFNLALAPFRQEQAANPPEGPEDSADHEFTDLGNGRRLVDLHGHRIRYCKPYADWLIYDGRRWSRDDRYEIESMAQQVPAQILTEIPPTRNEETITAYKKWAFLSQAKDRLLATINLARSMVSVTPNDLDRDPWLLNVQNGTIHLRTGQFLPHRPDDLITKIAQAVYDPAATAPHWERFLFEIMNGNESLVAYLRRAIGYSITGVIREHAFFFLYGVGRNGKTSLLNTLFTILGDYANQIDSDLLIAQNQTQHPTGLTELEGRRMVSADESDDGRRFAEAQVKRLTGGNMIQARRMNQNFYTFRPSHHLFFAANHKPEIRGMDPGIWRRIKMIPFEVSFDPALPNGRVPDLDLEDKLLRESSGILNWMLRGCREWQEFGLAEPAVVSSVVSSYQQEMDMLGWFLEERCYAEEGERAVLSVLFGEYLAWCRMTNILHPLSIRKFSNQLSDKGFTTKKSNSVVYKFGIRMKTEVERDIEGNSVDQEEGDFDWTTGRYSAQVPK